MDYFQQKQIQNKTQKELLTDLSNEFGSTHLKRVNLKESALPPPASSQSPLVRGDLLQIGYSELCLVLARILKDRETEVKGRMGKKTMFYVKNFLADINLILLYAHFLYSPYICAQLPQIPSLSLSLLTLSLFCFHSCVLPSDIALSPLQPVHIIPPPGLCGTGCFTSAVLTLTAPSMWCLISCSDTLSLYHANGPACVYAISTLSKTPENRERQIRETYIHAHPHPHTLLIQF